MELTKGDIEAIANHRTYGKGLYKFLGILFVLMAIGGGSGVLLLSQSHMVIQVLVFIPAIGYLLWYSIKAYLVFKKIVPILMETYKTEGFKGV